jgi:hypothetical protein
MVVPRLFDGEGESFEQTGTGVRRKYRPVAGIGSRVAIAKRTAG